MNAQLINQWIMQKSQWVADKGKLIKVFFFFFLQLQYCKYCFFCSLHHHLSRLEMFSAMKKNTVECSECCFSLKVKDLFFVGWVYLYLSPVSFFISGWCRWLLRFMSVSERVITEYDAVELTCSLIFLKLRWSISKV